MADLFRKEALESISGVLGDSAAYRSLQAAMDESIRLMDREYYAMRLAIAAFGLEDEDFPEVVMHAELSEEDALLPPEAQQAVARAGGDAKMGAYSDAGLTLFVMLPMVFLMARYTRVGPVALYCGVKVIDLIKLVVFHFWLKKERWLKNLTAQRG